MLQIKGISKQYKTGELVQTALDEVDLNLRDNEFVAILGPSGSGKTTLLNIIGGLDRYDSGDLVINGISTKKYKDRDWDSYRNHTIGFVFQSYNLIPHQSVLSNVELALTISGISKAERRERAAQALAQVGLGEQLHKKPNQMSGGQMQRVAIARALVNNPDIVLADEPTGALDSETSVQVMELLKGVAKDRLVVMVTHNPELAEEYANRTVRLKDGRIISDTHPLEIAEENQEEPEHKNMGKSSMSFRTALSLSFNNLKTKKARTLLTSFAGSIGIIGIALILALSTGADAYIQSIEEETLSEYPLQIQSTGFDLSSMMMTEEKSGKESEQGDVKVIQMVGDMFSTMNTNDLESLKKYLDSDESGLDTYTKAVEYSYSGTPQIYREDVDKIRQVNPDKSFSAMGMGAAAGANSMMSSMMSTNVFFQMPENAALYEEQYDVKAGRWPKAYNECVVVLTSDGSMSDFMMYTLGLRDAVELDDMINQFLNEEDIQTPENVGSYSYEEILDVNYKLVNSADYYTYDSEYKVWTDKTDNKEYMMHLIENGEDIKVVGVVQPREGANASALFPGIGYPASLTRYAASKAQESEIVKQQLADKEVDVFTNEPFLGEDKDKKDLEMDSLFSVDTNAIQNAFQFDESAFSNIGSGMEMSQMFPTEGGSVDLVGMVDFGNINLELPSIPNMDMEALASGLHLTVTDNNLQEMVDGLLAGYQEYAVQHPEADYSKITEHIQAYLKSSTVQDIFKEYIDAVIQANGGIAVPAESLKSMVTELVNGFQSYAAGQSYTDTEDFAQQFLAYLESAEALSILNSRGTDMVQANLHTGISETQLQEMAEKIADGYNQFAIDNQLPIPSMMGQHFLDYLNTPEGKERLSKGIFDMVNKDNNLEFQIAMALYSYMGTAMGEFSEELEKTLEIQVAAIMQQMVEQLSGGMETVLTTAMGQVGTRLQEAMGSAMTIDEAAFANAFQMNMNQEEMTELLMSMMTQEDASYEGNLQKLGYVNFEEPSGIDIYPVDFEGKEQVVKILDDYNASMEAEGKEEQVISYTDMVGTLMSSVTEIIDIISYVLIAFVAISLVVSSIMIGVITYISVLERRKEIGILRAIGASKKNVSQIFNAETFIIGLCSGSMGILLTVLILIPGNALIHHLADTNAISAILPVPSAVILILLSVGLTILGGLIPSKKAAKSDPVTALRVE